MGPRGRARPSKAAVGYARRSTDRQEQSIPDQERAVRVFAAEQGYELLDWYVDDAISGASSDGRAQFLRMIQDAQRGDCPFGTVLVYDVKRFGRLDNDETGHYRYLLKRAGVEVIYVSEGFSGDDTDDLIRPVKQWQARQELKDLSKVTLRGLLSRSGGGWWMGGRPPYGYDLSYFTSSGEFLMTVRFMQDGGKQIFREAGTLGRKLEPGNRPNFTKEDRAKLVLSSPERVRVIQGVFTWYVQEGLGYKAIADRLNRRGIPSPLNGRRGSGKWAMTTIREIVANPAYAGDMVWNRRSMAKFYRVQKGRAVPAPRIRTCVVEHNAEDDWVVAKGSHEAIVPRSVFRKARARRQERAGVYHTSYRRGRGAKSEYLLTGLIRCAHCGHKWQGYTQHRGRKKKDGSPLKTLYYGCGGYISKGTSVCKRSLVRTEAIEGMILGEIGKNLRNFLKEEKGRKALRSILEEMAGAQVMDVDRELEKLREKKEDLERRIFNILDNITAENREFADRRIGDLKKKLDELLLRMKELETSPGELMDLDQVTEVMLEYMKDFENVVAQGTVDEKRRFIRAFAKEIELDPESGTGRAQVFVIPDLTVAVRNEPATEKSSLISVAGAGFEPATSGL